jgi:DNA polymerase III delta prime subunit
MYTIFMNGTILIYGSDKQGRVEKINEIVGCDINNVKEKPDFLIIKKDPKKDSIGISQVREAIKFFHRKPYSEQDKVVVILNAEKMTIQAQNAFLKTLEEPPSYALIILETQSENSLLETVTSRCRKLHLSKNRTSKIADTNNLEDIINMKVGERIDWAEAASKQEKEEIIELLENWLEQGRDAYRKAENKNMYSTKVEIIDKIMKDLENTNVNKKIALIALVLNI